MEATVAKTEVSRPVWVVWSLLVAGIVVASMSAILTRYAFPSNADPLDLPSWDGIAGAHPIAISFWRCAIGAVVLAPFAFRRLQGMPRRRMKAPVLAGVFLAIHFATWITSLGMTSVAAAVLLVSTTPIFVAATARWVFGERVETRTIVGIAVALGGTAIITGGSLGSGASQIAGDLLALAGGATAAGYVLAGDAARRETGILEYSVIAYGVAAVLLLALDLALGIPLGGYPGKVWLALAALILGPQLFGHTVINYTLRDIGATVVSVAIMAEPVIATVFAFILFSEDPSLLIYPGGLAILVGIFLSSTARSEMVVVE
jgi:drug/metabolite transporter (DMT)-like permease